MQCSLASQTHHSNYSKPLNQHQASRGQCRRLQFCSSHGPTHLRHRQQHAHAAAAGSAAYTSSGPSADAAYCQPSHPQQQHATAAASPQQLLPLLLEQLQHDKTWVWCCAVTISLMILSKASGVQAARYLKTAVDAAPAGAAATLWPLVWAAACLGLGLICREKAYPNFSPLSTAVADRVAAKTFSHILGFDLATLAAFEPATLTNAIERAKINIRTLFFKVVVTAAPTLVGLLWVLVLLSTSCNFGWTVPAAVCCTWGAYVAWTLQACQGAVAKQREVERKAKAASRRAVNAMRNLEQVQLCGNTQLEVEEYDRLMQEESQASLACNNAFAVVALVQALIVTVGMVCVMVAAAAATPVGSSTTPGDLALLLGLLLQLLLPLHSLGQDFRESSKALAKMQEVAVVLSTQGRQHKGCTPLPDTPLNMPAVAVPAGSNPAAGQAAGPEQLPRHGQQHTTTSTANNGSSTANSSSSSSGTAADGRSHNGGSASSSTSGLGLQIQLEGVSFAYPKNTKKKNKDVTWQGLQGVSVRIESGQCVGIMGPSGTGKSTLLHLITGQCQPQQGTISINGVDLQDLDLSALWGALGFVPQEPFLQNDTVLEAIRYGKPTATEEEMKAAAKLAHLNGGECEEMARELSGGEKQRVAIARAFLRRPRLLILDEPTSALDAATEASILHNLSTELKQGSLRGCTCIMVSHRPSTVASCDNIFVLSEDGRIAEHGSPAELLERGGVYTGLWPQMPKHLQKAAAPHSA